MLLKNCNIVFLDKIEKGSILIENDVIKEINPKIINTNEEIDCMATKSCCSVIWDWIRHL